MNIIGIDCGNGFTKAYANDKMIKFRSCRQIGKLLDINKNKRQYDITYNDKQYILGADKGEIVTGANRFRSELYKTSVLTTITQMFDNIDKIGTKLVVGVPVQYYQSTKDKIKEEIMSWQCEYINVNNNDYLIEIHDVKVFIEGHIAFSNIQMFKNNKTLVIDIGTDTINALLFKGVELKEKITLDMGCLPLYSKISNRINSQGFRYRPNDIEDIISSNENYLYNTNKEKIDISFISDYIESHVNEIYSYLNDSLSNIQTLNQVILIGGGANIMRKYFNTFFGNTYILPNNQFANAKSFYDFGVIKFGK